MANPGRRSDDQSRVGAPCPASSANGPSNRRRSRIALAAAALSWLVSFVVAPSAWTGCSFNFSVPGAKNKVEVRVADDVDLSKINVVYVKIVSPIQGEFIVEPPSGGWVRSVDVSFPAGQSPLDLTVTAYDSQLRLMALGSAQAKSSGNVSVLISANVPWN